MTELLRWAIGLAGIVTIIAVVEIWCDARDRDARPENLKALQRRLDEQARKNREAA